MDTSIYQDIWMFLFKVTGFSLALLSMVLYSLYMVPRKKSSIPQSVYTLWMGIGILFSTTILGVTTGGLQLVKPMDYVMMFICGVVWATGSDAYCRAVSLIGLSRSTPIKNISAAIGTLLGIAVFGEFSLSNIHPLIMAGLGSIAVVASATILGRVENIDESTNSEVLENPESDKRTLIKGVLFALWAAVAYTIYTVPMKIIYAHHVTPSAFLLYMGHGCFIGMVLIGIIDTRMKGRSIRGYFTGSNLPNWKASLAPQLSGAMWALGSLFANIAVKHIGVAITWPITKSTLFAVAYGVFVLKEVDVSKNKRDLYIGLILSVVGIVLLAMALG